MARRSPLRQVRSILEALIFITATVTLAKVAQYAAVDQFGGSSGFGVASFIGATPVIVAAAFMRRWMRGRSEAERLDRQPSR